VCVSSSSTDMGKKEYFCRFWERVDLFLFLFYFRDPKHDTQKKKGERGLLDVFWRLNTPY